MFITGHPKTSEKIVPFVGTLFNISCEMFSSTEWRAYFRFQNKKSSIFAVFCIDFWPPQSGALQRNTGMICLLRQIRNPFTTL